MRWRTIASAGLAALAAACASTSVSENTPVRQSVAWSSAPGGAGWSSFVDSTLQAEAAALLAQTPRDIDAFCPGFKSAPPAGRRAFYIAFLAEIARAESRLDPGFQATAPDRDAPGKTVISRGLLPISPTQAAAAGCAISRPEELFDSSANLRCGVRILQRSVAADGLIAGWDQGWRGAARTWTSLRDREKLADLQSALNAQPYCAPQRRRNV